MFSMLALSIRNAYDVLIGSDHPTLSVIIKSTLDSLESSYRLSVWLLNSRILTPSVAPTEFVLSDDPQTAQAQLRELEKNAHDLNGAFHAKFSQELQYLSDVYESVLDEILQEEEAYYEDGEDFGETDDIDEQGFQTNPSSDTFEFSGERDFINEKEENHYWVQLSKAYLGLAPSHPVTNHEAFCGESELLRKTLIYKVLSNKNNPLRRIAQVAFSEFLARRSQRDSLNEVCERVLLVANQSHPNPNHAEINLTEPESIREGFTPLAEIRDLPLELTLRGELNEENIESIVTYLRRLFPRFEHIKLASLHINLDMSQASSQTITRFLDCLTGLSIQQLDLSFYTQIPDSPTLISALRNAVYNLKPLELVLQPTWLLSPTHYEITKRFIIDNPKLTISISNELQAEQEACPNAAKKPRFNFNLQHELLNARRARILELQALCSKIFDVFNVRRAHYAATDSQYIFQYINDKVRSWLKDYQANHVDARLREWTNREQVLVERLNADTRRSVRLERELFPSTLSEGSASFIADQFIRWFDGYIRPEITSYLNGLFIGMSENDTQIGILIDHFLSPIQTVLEELPEIPSDLRALLCTSDDTELATVCDAFRTLLAQRLDDDEAPTKIEMLEYFLAEDFDSDDTIIPLTSEGDICLDNLERLRFLLLYFKRTHESLTLSICDDEVIKSLKDNETADKLRDVLAQINYGAVSFPLRNETLHLLSLFGHGLVKHIKLNLSNALCEPPYPEVMMPCSFELLTLDFNHQVCSNQLIMLNELSSQDLSVNTLILQNASNVSAGLLKQFIKSAQVKTLVLNDSTLLSKNSVEFKDVRLHSIDFDASITLEMILKMEVILDRAYLSKVDFLHASEETFRDLGTWLARSQAEDLMMDSTTLTSFTEEQFSFFCDALQASKVIRVCFYSALDPLRQQRINDVLEANVHKRVNLEHYAQGTASQLPQFRGPSKPPADGNNENKGYQSQAGWTKK